MIGLQFTAPKYKNCVKNALSFWQNKNYVVERMYNKTVCSSSVSNGFLCIGRKTTQKFLRSVFHVHNMFTSKKRRRKNVCLLNGLFSILLIFVPPEQHDSSLPLFPQQFGRIHLLIHPQQHKQFP